MPQRFAEYRAVLAKIDLKFAEIAAQHPARFACRAGCHGCCLPGLTVSRVERDHIAAWMETHGAAAPSPIGDAAAHDGCAFLGDVGTCTIYDVRPAICRSHGAPIRVRRPGAERPDLDVCPLNFTNIELSDLDAGTFIDVDTLNLLLFVVGRRYAPDDDGSRFALTPDGICNRG